MQSPFNVYIIDDDRKMRDSLIWLIECEDGFNTHVFAAAEDFLDQYNDELEGCIILDVRMPYYSGLELQDHLNSIGCQLPIIFITGYPDVNLAVRAMKNGALEFLCKPFTFEALIGALRLARSKHDQNHYLIEKRAFLKEQIELLTGREKEVLKYVLQGYSNKKIAVKLGLEIKTVEFNRSKLRKKFKSKSLSELVKVNYGFE